MLSEDDLEQQCLKWFAEQDWEVLHGPDIAPDGDNPLRASFHDVFLRPVMLEQLQTINPHLPVSVLEEVILRITRPESPDLVVSNKAFHHLLLDGVPVEYKREDKTVHDKALLMDFNHPGNNRFMVVNQVAIQGIKQVRRPDIIGYINGLPVAVIELKSPIDTNADIWAAFNQLQTYKNELSDLFICNEALVISDGQNARIGSLTADEERFLPWKTVANEDDKPQFDWQLKTVVQGFFNRALLLDYIRYFVLFENDGKRLIKKIAAYHQFHAVREAVAATIVASTGKHLPLRSNITPGSKKAGVVWHTQGSGKSISMCCYAGKLLQQAEMNNPTIVVVTDRNDLDGQLCATFCQAQDLLKQTPLQANDRDELRELLNARESGGIIFTTVQKFAPLDGEQNHPALNQRSNIVVISDEAHRSQINLDQKVKVTAEGVERTYGFAKYLHDSLPNATYVGFTGTPVDGTIEVFGPVVDAYTMTEAVKDGITVNLVYDGRAARVTLDQAKVREIEDYYDRCAVEGANEHQIEESQKAVAHIDAIIGDPDRLHAVAEDFINHYETRVSEGATVAGKAMFVCSNRKIAYTFYQIVVGMKPEWAEKKVCPDGVELTEKEKKELKPIEKIKLIMTRNKDDEPELYEMLGTKDDRKEFDRQFKNVKSNFKIAIVVDMWLTGFDVPALDTIYIDKPIQQHTLIQTISRVNRVYTGKDKGLIVDYIGIKKNMNLALKKYTNFESDEFEGIEQSITIVKDQLDVLAQMFYNFNSTDYFNGSPKEQLACLNRAVEYVQLTEDLETRFMAAVKRMKQAFNLCSSSEAISDEEKGYLHFYCAVRSILFKLTKGDAPDISQMNARVRELLEGAIQSDGIEELFETGKHISVDIFSDEYLDKINAIQLPNTKIKVLQRLLSQAIDEYKKVNRIMGMEFSDRLKRVVDEYNNRRRDEAFANEVLDDVAEQLAKLLEELKKEKDSFKGMGIDYEEKAFYDILKAVAKKYEFEYPDDKMIELSKRIKIIVDDKAKYTDWSTRDDIKANLQVDLILLLDEFDYPPVTIDDVYKEVLEQAENFKKYAQ